MPTVRVRSLSGLADDLIAPRSKVEPIAPVEYKASRHLNLLQSLRGYNKLCTDRDWLYTYRYYDREGTSWSAAERRRARAASAAASTLQGQGPTSCHAASVPGAAPPTTCQSSDLCIDNSNFVHRALTSCSAQVGGARTQEIDSHAASERRLWREGADGIGLEAQPATGNYP